MLAQQSSIYEDTKVYNAYALNIHMNFGNHFRREVDHLLQGHQHILVTRCHCREKGLDYEATATEIYRKKLQRSRLHLYQYSSWY